MPHPSSAAEPDRLRAERSDPFVDSRLHSCGYGSDAVATICRHLIEAEGHHRITIDPAADNAAATGCYRKAGSCEVGGHALRLARPGHGRLRDLSPMELVRLRS